MPNPSSSLNVLVTGATGFLGSRLVKYLAYNKSEYRILATGRKFSHPNKIEHERVKYSLGDLTDKLFVKSLFDNQIDVVINCASLAAPWGKLEKFQQANIITQENLIFEAEKSNINRFIYISTPSIFFNYEDAFNINENSPIPIELFSHYASTKLIAEEKLKASKLQYIILRPRALMGRGDTVIMPRLIRANSEGRLRIIGDGNNQVNITSVGNMVEAIRLAIHNEYLNEDYNISNGEDVRLWDIINTVLELIGQKRIEKKIPYWIAYQLASLVELKTKILRSKEEPRMTKFGVNILSKSATFDIKKAKEKLAYEVKQSNLDALHEFANWYLENQD